MENFALVIVGITGNLAQIKLIPTLYDLVAGGLLNCTYSVVGIGRTPMNTAQFKSYISDVLHRPNRHHNHSIDPTIEKKLLDHMEYIPLDFTQSSSYEKLAKKLTIMPERNRMYYLATYPSLYATIFKELAAHNLTSQEHGWVRVLIEKPIGEDTTSSREVNNLLSQYFVEDQIFRLDHYLGKETLQNILTFRFANGVMEPLMDAEHIDHIQVTASEDFGIGARGSYYDVNGALKDVGQNHLLQMIALSTMSSPEKFENAAVTEKRVEALTSLIPEPEKIVFGQYEGYVTEAAVSPQSKTETFFAFRTHHHHGRFANIPIYVRAGKYLTRTATEVAIVFKNPAHRLFSHLESGLDPNILVYRIQPNEGIVLKMLTKVPGHELKLQESFMQFCYRDVTANPLPDAYERLIVDAFNGDQTFFNDAPEVEAQWKFIDPLVQVKQNLPIHEYARGSWGPEVADELIQADGRSWYEPSTVFCSI